MGLIMVNNKPIIAIVDDEKDICSVMATLFHRRGMPVCFIAYDGDEALFKFESVCPKPDIIMMDHRLQNAMGVDLMRKMLTIHPSTKFIFLSSDVAAMNEAYEAGAVLFLMKPVSVKTITDAIDIVYNNQGKYKYNGYNFTKIEV
jgi:two-component system, chemotaxis family, chemotaxis protein CheY